MSIFFLLIVVVYGGMHVLAFLRARSAFAFGPAPGAALALFMLFMVFAVFLIRALENLDYEISARALAYFAYCWMAALF
ncbi:MAG TPA: metallophosphoesterase, partial [Nitrospirota bacterium]|nr:metallophosphoesterase [Nitrospirota bacterium]